MTENEGVLSRFRRGLEATRNLLSRGFAPSSLEDLDELEELLIAADVGVHVTQEVVSRLCRRRPASEKEAIAEAKNLFMGVLSGKDRSIGIQRDRCNVILMVGVNGVGKTTSMAKLAHYLVGLGYRPVLAAADTFRAAAAEQLEVWGKRMGLPVIRQREGSDPAAVAFDAVRFAKARGYDTVLVDTAGRLHTKVNLMEELKKIRKVVSRAVEGAPQETLLVLDATTGQNALEQARMFTEAVGVTGIILAKMDGTAKGGIVLSVEEGVGIPVKMVAVGETLEDLLPFDPGTYLDGLFNTSVMPPSLGDTHPG